MSRGEGKMRAGTEVYVRSDYWDGLGKHPAYYKGKVVRGPYLHANNSCTEEKEGTYYIVKFEDGEFDVSSWELQLVDPSLLPERSNRGGGSKAGRSSLIVASSRGEVRFTVKGAANIHGNARTLGREGMTRNLLTITDGTESPVASATVC